MVDGCFPAENGRITLPWRGRGTVSSSSPAWMYSGVRKWCHSRFNWSPNAFLLASMAARDRSVSAAKRRGFMDCRPNP